MAASGDLIDLRAKVTPETDAVLSAEEHFEGCDRSELVRRILHAWAVRRIEASSIVQRGLSGEDVSGKQREAAGNTRRREE